MQPKARFTLIREQSMGATSAVFESDFDSVEAARQAAVTRARESMPWASQEQAAVMCVALETAPVGRTVEVNGWHYRIKANDAALREQEGPGGCRIERAWMTGHPVCRECGDECDCYVCVPDTPGERAWS